MNDQLRDVIAGEVAALGEPHTLPDRVASRVRGHVADKIIVARGICTAVGPHAGTWMAALDTMRSLLRVEGGNPVRRPAGDQATLALIAASRSAGDALLIDDPAGRVSLPVLRGGAATHVAALLINELAALGWKLTPITTIPSPAGAIMFDHIAGEVRAADLRPETP